jgi:hypothetical protein
MAQDLVVADHLCGFVTPMGFSAFSPGQPACLLWEGFSIPGCDVRSGAAERPPPAPQVKRRRTGMIKILKLLVLILQLIKEILDRML